MPYLNPNDYTPACAALFERDTLCAIGPGSPNVAVRRALEALDVAAVVGPHPLRDDDMAQCCIAALWLRHDFLDASHSISQGIASPSGSYWHGIMHRREGDYSNAKYWFRRAGAHPLYRRLGDAVRALLTKEPPTPETPILAAQTDWDPFLFVDLCRTVSGSGKPSEANCQKVADLEWQLLFDFCYRQATGP